MSNQGIARTKRITSTVAIGCAIAFGWLGSRAIQRVRQRRPLIEAVKKNDLASVRSLLDAGADPNARDVPAPSLSLAEIWQAIVHPHDAPGSTAATALQLAAVGREDDIARLLVEQGAKVNATSNYWPEDVEAVTVVFPQGSPPAPEPPGYTALMDACENHDFALTEMLLDRGAEPNQYPKYWCPALLLAISGPGFKEWAENFSDQKYTEKLVRMLLNHGARADGRSVVAVAMNNLWPCVLPMLEHGAEVNARSDIPPGRTLTIEAAAMNDDATITFLAKHHADLNATDENKRTAMMELCHRYTGELSIEALTTLLNHGANPNLQDIQGITALMEAAGAGKKDSFTYGPNLEAIQLLLQHGADATLKDKAGNTVLQRMPATAQNDEYGQKARDTLLRNKTSACNVTQ